jgi:two-component system chemotaxis sensor kinase CheA
MARVRFTLDEAAASLVQLGADDAGTAERLRDRLLRLTRSRALCSPARAEVRRAADALAVMARGGPDAAPALAAAGVHLEAALRAAQESADGRAAAVRDGPAPSAGDAAMQRIDPLMLAGLAALDMEADAGAATEAAAGLDAPVATAPVEGAAWSADADPELLESFVAESVEYLESAESALLVLEADTTNGEAVNTVFRCFHTIKGTSAFLGLTRVSELAHGAESLMSAVREQAIRLEGRHADLAFRSVDVLGELVRGVGRALDGHPMVEPEGFRRLVRALADPAAAADEGEAAAPVPRVPQPALRAADGAAGQAAEVWMRVRTDRLDRLVDTIGELVIAHAMIAQDGTIAGALDDALSRKVGHATKIVRELQDLSISMRMVPLKGVMRKLARVLRDAAAKSGKQIDLVVDGEDTEIDRNAVDVIGDPLVHMVRNAVDHGIESPAERVAAGKSPTGTIRISASHAGGSVLIALTDDGRGLDRARILAKAVSRGLVEPDRGLSDRDVFELIFAPGFSTAETVTALSGRGVGMDVVRRSVEALRGRIDIESEPGTGSAFSIRLPLTLAIKDGMLVRVGAERYIVPTRGGAAARADRGRDPARVPGRHAARRRAVIEADAR